MIIKIQYEYNEHNEVVKKWEYVNNHVMTYWAKGQTNNT
jgi:hypothetical protein